MPARPEIFISATTKDLKSCRELVRDALLTLGCVPVVQEHFAPEASTVREMLDKRLIARCDAIIHLAGECYGCEPQERAAGEPRRSYTQMEYDIARELKKPLYTFVCARDFPYDEHEPEDNERRALQEQHRAELVGGDRLYVTVGDRQELEKSVRELRFRVRSWIGPLVAAAFVALLLIGGLLWYLDHRTAVAEGSKTVLRQQNDTQAHEIAILQARLDEQTRTGQQILAIVQRNTPETKAGEKSAPLAAAQAKVATERRISVEDLKRQLAEESADVRTLLVQIKKESADTQAQAEQWNDLERKALTKLGDSEYAAGRYREAVEPYQQALALCDENKEPLVYCDAAQKLEIALCQMGRYTEADPLARRVVDRRTASQGAEYSDTLISVNNLASLLRLKGDYAGAESVYRRCLEAQERMLGKEHPDTLRSINNLAVLLGDNDDYAGAEPLYRRCLEAQERTLGNEHPDTLVSVNNLASLLCFKGDYAGAEPLYRRCLEAQERTLGNEHPDTLVSVNNLANVLVAKGDYAEAESLYWRCLKARERTLGNEHPGTAMTAFNFSLLQEKQGKLNEAVKLAEEAVAAAHVSLPDDHPYRRKYEQQLANLQAKITASAKPGP